MSETEKEDLFRLEGLVVVVTGGTGVLGTELSRALVRWGARVALVVRDRSKADALVPEALVLEADVLDPEALAQGRDLVLKTWGRVDALVNGAGGNQPGATTSPERSFFDLSLEALRAVVDLNLLGTILPCQIFGRTMAEAREGIILNISSLSGLTPLTRVPGYGAAKAGVANFTQWLAVHMAQTYSPKIRVNALAPGFFLTEQNRFLLTTEEGLTSRGQDVLAHTPQGRFGAPGDLLGTFRWLLSPASAFVTGVTVPVDGGFSAYGGV